MQDVIVCPQCGNAASYIMTLGHTIASCAVCGQATVLTANKIIKINIAKLQLHTGQARELLMIALTAEALFKNWHIIIHPTVHM